MSNTGSSVGSLQRVKDVFLRLRWRQEKIKHFSSHNSIHHEMPLMRQIMIEMMQYVLDQKPVDTIPAVTDGAEFMQHSADPSILALGMEHQQVRAEV